MVYLPTDTVICSFQSVTAVLGNQQSELHFETLSGRLTVSQKPANGKPVLQLALPTYAPSAAPQWLQDASPAFQVFTVSNMHLNASVLHIYCKKRTSNLFIRQLCIAVHGPAILQMRAQCLCFCGKHRQHWETQQFKRLP